MLYKKVLVFVISLSLVLALIQAATPYIIGKFLDFLISPELLFAGTFFEIKNFIFALFLFALLRILYIALFYLVDTKSRFLSEKIFADCHREAYKVLISYPISFYSDIKIGKVDQILNRAHDAYSNIIGSYTRTFLPQFLTVIVSLLFSFFINFYLSLILLLGIVLYVSVALRVVEKLKEAVSKTNILFNKVFANVYELLAQASDIKRNATEDFESRKLDKHWGESYMKTVMLEQNLWAKNTVLQKGTVFLTRFIIFSLAGYFVLKSEMTIGELSAVAAYSLMVFQPFQSLFNIYTRINTDIVKIKEAENLLSKKPEKYQDKSFKKLESVKGEVVFENVSFSYPGKKKMILKDISFQAKAGQTVALVGRSGSGKSTAVDLISALYFPTKGKVKIDGISTEKLFLKDLRSSVAYVSQDISLLNDTVYNNIKYGSENAKKEDVFRAAKLSFCDEFIQKFDKKYKQKVGTRGVKLSGGQKQRIAIARAVLRDSKILILDEPTSALDLHSEKVIIKSLKALMKNRTTFIIAHRISTVKNADLILLFKDGEVVERGSFDALVSKKGEFKKMYDLHIGLN